MNDDVESCVSERERLLFNSSIKDQTVQSVEHYLMCLLHFLMNVVI
jgi:hypothetical protein